ncbi:MAG: redox-regulated ATPase YchF [Cyanobacteriota bacterium]
MKIAIIGLPQSGKTTVFNLLTESNVDTSSFSAGKTAPNISVVKVPDKRVDLLTDIYKPKKKTYAEIVFEDFVGIKKEGKKKVSLFSEAVKQADALVHVCRIFENDTVPHPSGKVCPLGDAETIELELILADLIHVENRLERLQIELNRKKTPDLEIEADLMPRLKEHLESEKPLRDFPFTELEDKVVRGYCYLSKKPLILVANVDENQLSDPPVKALEEFAKNNNLEFQVLCASLEMEISQMSEEEQKTFFTEYGIEKSARDIFIRKAYEILGLISFFTVGDDEVKAWTVIKGTEAMFAAGVIHSDLQRGFIRSETVSYNDFIEAGSMVKVKEKGHLRQEGKTYIVQDGDIMNIKFNV